MTIKNIICTIILLLGLFVLPAGRAYSSDLQSNTAKYSSKNLSMPAGHISGQANNSLDPILLFDALRENSLEKVQVLISDGVDLEVKNGQGETPLMLALKLKEEEIARLLIEKGADVNSSDDKGWTPLMIALQSGVNIGQFLLNNGAELNILNKRGWSPLMLSIKYSTPENSLMLIEKGAELEIKAEDGESPLLLSAAAGDVDVLSTIIEKVKKLNEKDKNGNSLLHLAAGNGNLEAVKLLLNRGANHEEINHEGLTPLLLAFVSGQTETALFLLGKDASYTANVNGNTALHYAAQSGNEDCVALLLPGIFPVDIKNIDGETPLYKAGNRQVAKYLLMHGAELDSKTGQGITPLHMAAGEGRVDVVEFLIEKGADINTKAKVNGMDEITPLYMSIANRKTAAAFRLLEAGAVWQNERKDGMNLFFLAVNKDLQDIVKLMLAKGQDINYRNKQGQSAIHFTAGKAMLEILLANGAKQNDLDLNGASALHFAVADGRLDVVEALLDKKADIMQKTKQGYTPLHFVNDWQTAQLLMANGAKLYVKNNKGMTPLEFARYFGKSKDVVSYLTEMEKKQDENIGFDLAKNVQVIRINDPDNMMDTSVISEIADDNFRGALTMMASHSISGNTGMALGLMHSAANTGCKEACYCMGEWAAAGKGMEANATLARLWYLKAAEMGMAEAQYWMGIRIVEELSDDKSYDNELTESFSFGARNDYYEEAYIWMSVACAQGHLAARKILDEFRNAISGAGSFAWEKRAAAKNGQRWGFDFIRGKQEVEAKAPLIMFYESDGNTGLDEPVYGMRFSRDTARYVIWHMELNHSEISKNIELPLTVVLYDPDGFILSKQQQKIKLVKKSETTQNEYGCGYDKPGSWDKGSYTVEFFVGKIKIAKVFFIID